MKSFNTNTNTNTTNTTTTTTIPMLDPKSPDFSLFATALIDKLFPRVALAATSTTTDTTTTPTASPKTPEQPLHVFMYRLMQLTTLPSQITYLAIYYITQLKIKNPKLKLGMGIERRLIVACIVIAQKVKLRERLFSLFHSFLPTNVLLSFSSPSFRCSMTIDGQIRHGQKYLECPYKISIPWRLKS